ncbi:MAG: cupin domain-containing protein [Bacteroidota bacterium]
MNLPNEINYQPNSIVSKILAKNNSGNATLFAMDEKEIISEHTTPFLAMIYCLEGKLIVNIDKKPNQICKEDFILLPQNISHAVEAIEKSKFILIMLK